MLSDTLAAVVVNRNGGDVVLQCLQSLFEGSQQPHIVVVVDNNSTDGSDRSIEQRFPEVQLLRASRNLGYAAALNRGIEQACRQRACLLLLMNNDVIVNRHTVKILIQHWQPHVGMLGPKVFRMDQAKRLDAAWGNILFHHVICRLVGEGSQDSPRFSRVRSVDALLGCMLLTSCAVVQQMGPLDPDYFMYMEEIDYAYRMRRLGKEILFVPDAHVRHLGGHATRESARKAVKTFYVRRNAVLFLRKHGNITQWCKFLLSSLASLIFCLLTLRWQGFRLRLRGYMDGFRVKTSTIAANNR
ncbi:MAG: glycosyltransferase family 2 protein [Acidobacteria bacterium]|nr:glycosyltransferase family 2 protein [Acidobacteriota bacterium]